MPKIIFCGITWLFRPGPSFIDGLIKLSIWSSVVTGVFLFIGDISFPGGANGFFIYADILAKGGVHPGLFARDIGYPLLLLVSGYQYTHSVIPLLLIQALMAWAMPMLVYATVGNSYRVAGFWAGLTTICSFSPYMFMKWIHHDQLYIFSLLLATFACVRFLRTFKFAYLYGAVLALLVASLTRPAGNLMFIPMLAIIWAIHPKAWKHYLLSSAIVLIVTLLYSEHRSKVLGTNQFGEMPSYTGRQIFYNLYVNSADYGIRLDEIGPETTNLFRVVQFQVDQNELLTFSMRRFGVTLNEQSDLFWFRQYKYSNKAFMENLIKHPNQDYFLFMCLATGLPLSRADKKEEPAGVPPYREYDSLFLKSAKEIIFKHPLYFLKYTLRNSGYFVLDPGHAHGRGNASYDSVRGKEALQLITLGNATAVRQVQALPEPAKSEILKAMPPVLLALHNDANRWFYKYYTYAKHRLSNLLIFCVALLSLIGAIFYKEIRNAGLITWVFFLYNALVSSAFAEPSYRYYFMTVPLLMILMGLGIASIAKFVESISKYLWPAIDFHLQCDALANKKSSSIAGVIVIIYMFAILSVWALYVAKV
jgi:hypothetical protein